MQNIHEILKAYGLEVPSDKKADFDKTMVENYKTVAEVQKVNDKLKKTEQDFAAAKQNLSDITDELKTLKDSNASAAEWEEKFNKLSDEIKLDKEQREKAEAEASERAEFDKYFADNKKEWTNPFIADGYFGKYKEAKNAPENKGKMSADILHELTKDDATAFKGVTPTVTLKGAASFGGANVTKDVFDKMGYKERVKLFNENKELYENLSGGNE